MADHARTEATQDRDQFAAYVAQLTSELAASARKHGLDALGYLLDMAQLEAENAAHLPRPADAKAKVAHR